MASTAGIPLIELLDLSNTVESALPDAVRTFVGRFVAVDYSASHSDAAIFHRGALQALDDTLDEIPTDFDIGIGRLSLPLVNEGIPFQLAFQRAPVAGNLEPSAASWRLDLSLDVFTLTVRGLRPAIYVPDAGTTPRHLVRDPNRQEVRITGSAVLRIERPAGGSVQVSFVDQPDPLDPAALSGAVATLSCSPPHFFLGGSEFGLSVGRLQFDFAPGYSTPEVIERGQGPGWMGVAIQEATLYAPRNLPGLGDLSGGVKNVLIGSPMGLQGELEIQFGRTAMDPAAFQFEQVLDSGTLSLGTSGAGVQRTVTLQGSQGADATVRAGFVTPAPPADGSLPAGALQDWTAEWTWPDGHSETADASSGSVRHGQTLRVTPIETVTVGSQDTEFRHPDISFRFVVAGNGPKINLRRGSEFFENVTHLGGTVEAVGGVQLEAVSGASGGGSSSFEWQINLLPERFAGPNWTPQVAGQAGITTVILREKLTLPGGDEEVRYARMRLHLRAGPLLVGCEAGVFDAGDDATRLALAAVIDTYDLSDFHAEGQTYPRLEQATLDPADPSIVEVPPDGLAQVTIAGPAPAVLERDRHVQLLMDFDTASELRWGTKRPAGTGAAFSQSDLLAWAARYPGAQFLVIGRCDDIGSDSYNLTLARDRAARGVALLTALQPGQIGTPLPAASVFSRGEQSAFGNATGDDLEEDPEIALSEAEKSEAVAGASKGRLIHAELPASTSWDDERFVDGALSEHEPVRDDYRRVDIYAVGGAPTPETALRTDEPVTGAQLLRSMVPAPGRDPAPVAAGSPSIDYRVKLRIVWDSPTVSQLQDAIPTLAEAEFAWTPQTMPLPPIDGEAVELSREVLTVFVNWTHDARTGFTKASLGIRSEGDPDGLVSVDTKPLVAALAFGPALLSGVDADTDLVGSGARVAALLAAVGFASVDLGDGKPLLGDGSKAALTSAAFETEMRSISDPGPDMQLRVLTDYVCTLHINGGVLGIRTVDDQPMKIRYKRVGIEYDTSKDGWERFGLVYDTSAMEIEDPGRWQIDGVLGSLLRIVEVAMGRGSVWIEGRIAIAIEIGLVEITEAIIRLTFRDGQALPDFELRGFTVKANIPAVLEGEGRLRIEDGGVIRAGVQANILPVGLGADAALALAKMGPADDPWMFLSLYLGVQFNTPLPLAQSGLAIYGFKGLFTMNGARRQLPNPDPVLRELDWWATAPENKYEPSKGQFALGVGVVVGTMPDVSFCVSCAGMLVVAFPDPEVILGVDVKIIEVPDTTVKDQGGASGTITGLIVIDDEAVKLAVGAQYTIPKVLEVKVPFAGYFPYPGTGRQVYVRIGSDGQAAFGRHGEPVTLKLLPGTLDVRAWTYLMIEQGGLPSLGGDARFSFEGFSVGFGAGWEIRWKAGPIRLEASAKVLVGFGTAPLIVKGGVFVAGELDLVVVSISARGELILEAREFRQGDGSQDVAIRIEGEFCGEVDLWFFSISGCVGVKIDLSPELIPPAPPSPLKGISLIDRRDRIMGTATAGTPQAQPIFVADDPSSGAAVDDNHTVWPDTAPVLHFSHYVENAMGAGAQFQPGPLEGQDRWFGSNALKYAYRLDSVVLRKRVGGAPVTGAGPLRAVWTSTPYRQPEASGASGPVPSEHEGPNLKLLDWNPWNWVVNMNDGGAGQPGDPVDTVDTLCDPKPLPQRRCVLGESARRAGFNRVRLRSPLPPQPPYPSRFFVTGEPVVRAGTQVLRGQALQTLVTTAGGQLLPGAVEPLAFAADVHGESVDRGYRLAAMRRAVGGAGGGAGGRLQDVTLPWEGLFSQPVTSPSVMLMICDAQGQGRPDGGAHEDCDDFHGLKPGRPVRAVKRPRMRISTVEPRAQLQLVDELDQRSDPVRRGADGSAELRFPATGVLIELDAPCDHLVVYVAPMGHAVKGQALAADGSVLGGAATVRPHDAPQALVFRAQGIAAVRLEGGAGEASIFKVCCHGDPAGKDCEGFVGMRPDNRAVKRFEWKGMVFAALDGNAPLRRTDAVNAGQVPAVQGRDGNAEVFFPEAGMHLTLAKPCPALELHLMVFTSTPVAAVGFDASGRAVAKARSRGASGEPQVLVLEASAGAGAGVGIVAVTLTGGGEAALYRICCLEGASRAGDANADWGTFTTGGLLREGGTAVMARAAVRTATTVTGLVDDRLRDPWPGRLVDRREGRDGRSCELIVFEPRDAGLGPWDGFRIDPPPGKTVTVVSVCGIDQRAADARAQDAAVAAHLVGVLTQVTLLPVEERREIVLEPDTEYEIAVGWSWQAWEPATPDEQPPAPSPSAWTAGGTDLLRFRTAPDSTHTDERQDGLNEHVFDVRDIDRYLVGIEPADGRAVHFLDDPVWIHFDAGHVEQLLEQYGRALEIQVRRTDPPPKSPAAPSGDPPLPVVVDWHALPWALQPRGYQRLNDALSDRTASPCVPDGTPLGGASAAVHVELEPDADYDLDVLAPKGGDRPKVRGTRFHSSRYASPRAMIDALGFTHPERAPYLPDDLVVAAGALPADGFVEGDAALDATLAAIDAETLPLPTRAPRTLVLWSHDDVAGWRVEGLLIDALEPMKRETTVLDASGAAVQGTRIEPLRAALAGQTLSLYRANARWTRVLFRPATPIALGGAAEHGLSVAFATSDAGELVGARRLLAVPSLLEREGL